MYRYRYKPNVAERERYAQIMSKREEMIFIPCDGAIREGCKLKWHSKSDDVIYIGVVNKETYRSDGQHQFSIKLDNGKYKSVMGRNLYDSLLEHVPGEISKKVSRY